MIVPQFWAEGRAHARRDGRSFTVRRFGWSDASQGEAQANADARAAEAIERNLAGERLDRRERKVPYNGADGLPIREEITSAESSQRWVVNYKAFRVTLADVAAGKI